MNTEMNFWYILLQWKCIKTADMIKTKFFIELNFFEKSLSPYEPEKKL